MNTLKLLNSFNQRVSDFRVGMNDEFVYWYVGTTDSKSTIWVFEFYGKRDVLAFLAESEGLQPSSGRKVWIFVCLLSRRKHRRPVNST